MWINEDMSCCGVREIAGLSEHRTAEDAMKGFVEETFNVGRRYRYVIFTAAGKAAYGTNFAAYILENKLGSVIETETNRNPNSGNQLKLWVWTINHPALVRWEKKHPPRDAVIARIED